MKVVFLLNGFDPIESQQKGERVMKNIVIIITAVLSLVAILFYPVDIQAKQHCWPFVGCWDASISSVVISPSTAKVGSRAMGVVVAVTVKSDRAGVFCIDIFGKMSGSFWLGPEFKAERKVAVPKGTKTFYIRVTPTTLGGYDVNVTLKGDHFCMTEFDKNSQYWIFQGLQ